VLEEAPRVIGQEVLQRGPNIFSTIAREGRKFNIGLLAITQLPSLIPKQILANMNTKIILGLELASERRAIIESASQDLSKSEKTIASLDMGEAIITSNFTKFAVPIKLPHFEKIVSHEKKKDVPKQSFRGLVS
ncbi:MAG: ATP-binding protein, partial [Candidatus Aenigmarchaeota archaeon]|nr:ATP-binding protein [Candidatus Aenigmarchaeota archaeon]